ncbi:hypothetical protein BTW10_15140 [Chromohalobacter japonicus]|uniref:DUF4174 domain-containing protein n=2 Tax=Chromohalobacter TaxID=42054 RepID=A0A1Q8T9M3_9GAMM|nr:MULTISPECIES: DUF4174 domain-containing protein [Chromohalobacter]OLO10377.1 hypothetical protein BTW10_15140 [Chromohalobacter japonicus]SOC54690.1 protein of unknown function [Chromohalobacter canadensis]
MRTALLACWMLVLLGPVNTAHAADPANPLITDHGLFRPLVIVSPQRDDDDYQRMRTQLRASHAKFEARDMVLYRVENGQGYRNDEPMTRFETQALLKALTLDDDASLTTVLIGKDGGKKMQLEGFVAPETVYHIIDQMPMRAAERD